MYKSHREFKSGGKSGGYKGGKSFGRGGFGGGGFGKRGGNDRGRSFDRPELFETVCGECHNACRVPFRPTGSRPVLCNNCFRKEGGGMDSKPYGRPSFDKPSFRENRSFGSAPSGDSGNVEKQLKMINEKLDSIIEALND